MNLSSLWSGRCNKRLLWGCLVVLAVFACCAFFRIWSPRDIEAYVGMASECHPVWRQFAFRRVGSGSSASDLLRRYPPTSREEFGRYGVYLYCGSSNGIAFTGVSVVTRDGKLVSAAAGSCTWRRSFFQTEDAELDRQYAVFVKERHERLEGQRLGRLEKELRKFYSQHSRWPSNELEFSVFVSPGIPSYSTNDLGITLVQRLDGGADIAMLEFPNDRRSVTRPDGERTGHQ